MFVNAVNSGGDICILCGLGANAQGNPLTSCDRHFPELILTKASGTLQNASLPLPFFLTSLNPCILIQISQHTFSVLNISC